MAREQTKQTPQLLRRTTITEELVNAPQPAKQAGRSSRREDERDEHDDDTEYEDED